MLPDPYFTYDGENKLFGSIIQRVENVEFKLKEQDKENAKLKTYFTYDGDKFKIWRSSLDENGRLKQKLDKELKSHEEHLNQLD